MKTKYRLSMLSCVLQIVCSDFLFLYTYRCGLYLGTFCAALLQIGLLYSFREIWKSHRAEQQICNLTSRLQAADDSGEIQSYMDRIPENVRDLIAGMEDFFLRINKQQSVQILSNQAEFAALQSQINPHFLYNTLESIRGQAIEEGNYETAAMTKSLASFFRYSISKNNDLVTLQKELENIHHYMSIQQYRFEGKFAYRIVCDHLELVQDNLIPKLTIQPLVENAIFHGLEPKLDKCLVTIRILATNEQLIISVEDNGVGIRQDRLDGINSMLSGLSGILQTEESSGIALQNINKRIRLHFGSEYGLRIYSTLGVGTEAQIVLPNQVAKA